MSADTPRLPLDSELAERGSDALATVLEGAAKVSHFMADDRIGVPQALGLSPEEWVARLMSGTPRLNVPERRRAVGALHDAGYSNREIGRRLEISEPTVRRDLAALGLGPASNDALDKPEAEDLALGLEQKTGAASNDAPAEPPADEPDPEQDNLGWQPGPEPAEPEPWPEPGLPAPDPEPTSEPEVKTPQQAVSEGDEWYTPKWLFDGLGLTFDLDVCSPIDRTHTNVPAESFFTVLDDGLGQDWHGLVWCNPPYSRSAPWAERMVEHGSGLLLTHIPMNARWCTHVWQNCHGIRLFQGMEFVRPDGALQRPAYWLQLAAFGIEAVDALSRMTVPPEIAANERRVPSPLWVGADR